MAIGPGKYDDVCSEVRRLVGHKSGEPGGVLLIVFGGERGSGFACQADFATTLALPDILEAVAAQIRKDGIV